MKIQFISSYSQLYGSNRSLLTILKYFNENGYEINILLPSRGEMGFELDELGISYDIVPYYSGFLYLKPIAKHLLIPILAILDLLLFPLILWKVKKFNPDIIYSNSSLENIGIFISKIIGKKHIQHVREFMSEDFKSYFIFGKYAKQKFINWSNGVVYVSNAVKNHINKAEIKSPISEVIYNGIVIPYENLPMKEYSDTILKFGVVGIFDISKRQLKAIEYFNKTLAIYPNSELHLFGDKEGGYKKSILELIQKLNLDKKVILHGFIEKAEIIYRSIDILLMFSNSEGFGRVTIEAMAFGVPVIGFDNAGTKEIIQDRYSGCLFSDFDTYFKAINYLAKSKSNYNKIRDNAFEIAKSKYNEKKYVKSVENFVQLINRIN